MKRLILAAGVAALAISVPAASQPGNKGGGGDKGRPAAAKVQKGGGGGKAAAQRGNQRQAVQQRSNGRQKAVAQARQSNDKRGASRAANRSTQRDNAARQARNANAKAAERRNRQVERSAQRRQQQVENRADRRDVRGRDRQVERLADRRDIRLRDRRAVVERRDQRLAQQQALVRNGNRYDWDDLARRGVWVDGCPPGLAKKPVPCVPPGQAKNYVGQPLSAVSQRVAFRDLPDKLRYVYQDTPDHYYRYGDGYVYRINRQNDVVSSLLPLFGLGLTAGQAFPSAYSNYYLPTGLQSFYPDSPYTDYRYANGYVYQVDPITGLIEDVDPMLGYGYGYGQMLPVTYSAYNVPYQYRPLYADTSDYYYRYAPGAIYQVDPETSLITAVAALLTGGFNVGQPLPAGYGVYNVPYGYRDQYYDTPNDWYRYANGSIYRVDPTTQLVTALVASVLT